MRNLTNASWQEDAGSFGGFEGGFSDLGNHLVITLKCVRGSQ